ncbi:hypothetical protein GC163_13925 [bacterium]|nr:hypothetical protein [bacterium]
MSPLDFSDRITCLPVIHGSGDCAVEVRRLMLSRDFDCLAVPLPPSFQARVEQAIEQLPQLSMVLQREPSWTAPVDWSPDAEEDERDTETEVASYVPIDPCQPVIAALRLALGERLPRAYIDLETDRFESYGAMLPDPYALKQVAADRFAAAVLPTIPRPASEQGRQRVEEMGRRLRELEQRYERILLVCSMIDWPWIREAYRDQPPSDVTETSVEETETYAVESRTSLFLLGELPFITGLYESARAELEQDENLSLDGVKALLLATRDHYKHELGRQARTISPKLLQTYFQYVRNLSLIERRLTPDFYTLMVAAQQIFGDQFAQSLAEVARTYPYDNAGARPEFRCGIQQGRLPDGTNLELKNRLPGQVIHWRSLQLKPKPLRMDQFRWQMRWNPYRQCSWPPEDVAIEKFRTHVKETALSLIGSDLARSEKFSTSLKDGLDIRETLRNWHTGDLYVKVLPPTRGSLDSVVMLFDAPADPRDYPWRVTWHAEHHDESTLALFATDFSQNLVGPGIGQALYGGALFLFPPRPIPDIWRNQRFDFTDTLEERLLSAACFHAEERHVAVLSALPPGQGWKKLAKRFGKTLVHVPLSRFSQEQIQQLRIFHVLNGTQIRSYASNFIRKA